MIHNCPDCRGKGRVVQTKKLKKTINRTIKCAACQITWKTEERLLPDTVQPTGNQEEALARIRGFTVPENLKGQYYILKAKGFSFSEIKEMLNL